MSLDRLINILVTITLVEMMMLIGFRATFAELVRTARNWRLVARAVAANYLFVPAATVALLVLFEAAPMVAAEQAETAEHRQRSFEEDAPIQFAFDARFHVAPYLVVKRA